MNGKVLVTPRSIPAGSPALGPLLDAGFEVVHGPAGRQPTVAELVDLVDGCHGWVAGVEPVPSEVFAAASELRVVSRNGVGTDSIDMNAAEAAGVRVVTAPGANANGVAELTVMLMLAGLRHFPRVATIVASGGWERPKGRELAGARVGLVGFGSIGRGVARLLQAFGAAVVAADPAQELDTVVDGVAIVPREEVLACDVVSLHVPHLGNRPLLDAAAFAAMGPNTVLVNTARGQLVDHAAAVAALDDGTLAAYAVDAFAQEPPELDDLLSHPRVIATPHIGGATTESSRRAADAAVANLLTAL